MERLKINPNNPSPKYLNKAAEVLKTGGLLIYPTDTAYGLGANALDEDAVRKMYLVKGRDFSKPTHVVVRDWKMIDKFSKVNLMAKKLYNKFLPGPLTLILPKRPNIPDILTSGTPTIGIRIPNNLLTTKLSSHLEFPYTTPSANRSGGKTPYSVEEVKKELDIEEVDLILDAGKLPPTPPSTIVDLTGKAPKLLRQGPILISQIEKALAK